jgi:hypothetical protein
MDSNGQGDQHDFLTVTISSRDLELHGTSDNHSSGRSLDAQNLKHTGLQEGSFPGLSDEALA